ncbi:MAG TPA: Spy/CpxP family protein refolding chaperone [Oligoflexus sp.]|uniref:Spy/CpxP family protein refolding chaperone n=1 Tax=Oligoflexus sp. TaxID=1971216 RepID=UPI002D4F7959|nr:Spy/CpxP family protein refolding chaperone [Oligoflexus sp.]HYX37066.1 Spy/CpxP family protein refolding chaperone [Oligoflexus sp.]
MRSLIMTMLLLMGSWNSQVALAQPPDGNPEKQIQQVLKTVQLNQEQKRRVRQIRESSRNRLQSLRDELDKRREELNQQLDHNGDDETVRQAFQKLQTTKMALEKARFERMLAIRGVLSEQQRSAFQNLRQKSRAANRAPGPSDTRRE